MADLSSLGAGITLGTYAHIVDPLVRHITGMQALAEGSVLVVDEGHNIEEVAMEAASVCLEREILKDAASQHLGEDVGSILLQLADSVPMARTTGDAMLGLSKNALVKSIALLHAARAAEVRCGRASPAVRAAAYNYCEGLFRKLLFVLARPEGYLLVRTSQPESCELLCVDSNATMKDLLMSTHATIYISGTLPELRRPLCGHPCRRVELHYPPLFYAGRLLVRCVSNLGATILDSRQARRPLGYMPALAAFVASFARSVKAGGAILVYFPGYDDLRAAADHVAPLLPTTCGLYREDLLGQGVVASIAAACASSDTVVCFAVARGRLSEGANLKGRLCRVVMVCGIPFAKPTARHTARFSFQDSESMALTAVNQMCGRGVRNAQDYAACLLLDCRYPQYSHRLSPFLASLLEEKAVDDVVEECRHFFHTARAAYGSPLQGAT